MNTKAKTVARLILSYYSPFDFPQCYQTFISLRSKVFIFEKMREEDSNWFSKWEEELPSPEELIPLSQSLITPDLAIAFDLHRRNNEVSGQPSSGEFAGDSNGEEPARTLKRPRLVWTPQLHKRFVDAVAHLGIKNAVPVPPHFLHPTAISRQSSEHFMPSFVPISSHQQQIVAAQTHLQPPSQFLHRQISAGNPNGKVMDQSLFLARQSQQQQVFRPSSLHLHSQVGNYTEGLEPGAKTVLTLFPTRDD